MKLNQLEALIAIADDLGIAGAAKKLNVSRPAITKSLASIEHELQVELFDRTEYRLKPNKYAKKLLTRARAIVAEHDQALRDIELMKQREQHIIRLAGSPGTMPIMIPHALQLAHQQEPGLIIEFVGKLLASSIQKYQDLTNGVSDLLITAVNDYDEVSNFKFEPLITVKLVLVASNNHPATKLKNPTLCDLLDYQWIVPHEEDEGLSRIKKSFSNAGAQFPESAITLPNRQMMMTLLRNGEYLAFIPHHPAITENELDEFDCIELPSKSPSWQVHLVQRKFSVASPALLLFIEKLKGIAQQAKP